MKRMLILLIALFVFSIPSITKAESSVAYRQNNQQDQYRLEEQQRNKQERDRQRRDSIEQNNQQRANAEKNRQQRDRVERDRQHRDRVEQDRPHRDRVEHDRQQRDRMERDRQQRDRMERDRQQRGRMERNGQRDHQRQNDHHRDSMGQKRNHDWSHSAYNHDRWRSIAHPSFRSIPFNWHDRAGSHPSHHHFTRIYDRHWHDRFPGLRIFRWTDSSGIGFWYNDHHIVDAMMFYNDSDELVSIGFFYNKIFIMVRDDGNSYENHDNFFLLWWLQQ